MELLGFPVVMNPPTMQETQERKVWPMGREDPQEEEMGTHSNILAEEISWTEEPGGLYSKGSQRVRHNWAHTCLELSTLKYSFIKASVSYANKKILRKLGDFYGFFKSQLSQTTTKTKPVSLFNPPLCPHNMPSKRPFHMMAHNCCGSILQEDLSDTNWDASLTSHALG